MDRVEIDDSENPLLSGTQEPKKKFTLSLVYFSISFVATLILVIVLVILGIQRYDSSNSGKNEKYKQTIIVISFDGFRSDYLNYLNNLNVPNFKKLLSQGTRATLQPCFPTKTFPNHYSMITGLYPERHGIIANNMINSEGQTYGFNRPESQAEPQWYEGKSLWATAQEQNFTVASYFWLGSEAPGIGPKFLFRPYNQSVPFATRVSTALEWLDLGLQNPLDGATVDFKGRPQFITLYFEQPDTQGHLSGPVLPDKNPQVIEDLDSVVLGPLLNGLKDRGLWSDKKGCSDGVSIILVSDHGMAQLSPEKVIVLQELGLNITNVKNFIETSPVSLMFPVDDEAEQEIISTLNGSHPNLHVYKKQELPERLHYWNNDRIPPVVAYCDVGYTIVKTEADKQKGTFTGGNHGYDPEYPEMQAMFIGVGKRFKKNHVGGVVENVNLYPMFANLLGLEPSPNNGTLDAAEAGFGFSRINW